PCRDAPTPAWPSARSFDSSAPFAAPSLRPLLAVSSLPTVSPDQVQELLSFSAPLRSSRAATRSDELPVSVLKQPWQDWRMSCHSCASGGGLASKSAAQGTQVREESLDLLIRRSDSPSPSLGPIEVVERKGLGHPDSICDAIAE